MVEQSASLSHVSHTFRKRRRTCRSRRRRLCHGPEMTNLLIGGYALVLYMSGGTAQVVPDVFHNYADCVKAGKADLRSKGFECLEFSYIPCESADAFCDCETCG